MLSISKISARAWNSPTFTTWGNLTAEIGRVLAITPLLLAKLDAQQVAIWYLFSSLLVFGTLITTRISLTFSRMIAFAMAGASDLSPLISNEKRGTGSPNWTLVKQSLSTINSLNLLGALLTALSAGIMGYFAASNLTSGYDNSNSIYLSLTILISSQIIITAFSGYEIALKGMNFVALTNRWNVVFSVLSALAGTVTLSLGGRIVELTIAMQSVQLLSLVRMGWIKNVVHSGILKGNPTYGWNREIIGWACIPFLKGLCTSIAANGVLQLGCVVYTKNVTATEAGSFLFSLRMLQAGARFAEAPILSNTPFISKLIAAGETSKVRKIATQKIMQSQILLAVCILALGLLLPILTPLFSKETLFLERTEWIILTVPFICQRYLLASLRLPAMANHIVCFKSDLAAALISFSLLVLVSPGTLTELCIAVFLPQIILMNLQPYVHAAKTLGLPVGSYLLRTFAWTALSPTILLLNK